MCGALKKYSRKSINKNAVLCGPLTHYGLRDHVFSLRIVLSCNECVLKGWLNRCVSEWCDRSGTKLNARKTRTMAASRSRTMHNPGHAQTIGGAVLNESDDLVVLEWHLIPRWLFRSINSLGFQSSFHRLGILRKSWLFHDRSLLGRCFPGFVLLVLEYCSAVWCSAADTHLKLPDLVVSGARFLTGCVFECDIAHFRSVAVLCILYKIGYNPMRTLYDAQRGLYMPVGVTRGALVAHRHIYSIPRCRTQQCHRTFIPFSVSLWNDHAGPVFDGVGLAGFKSRANAFLLRLSNKKKLLIIFVRLASSVSIKQNYVKILAL